MQISFIGLREMVRLIALDMLTVGKRYWESFLELRKPQKECFEPESPDSDCLNDTILNVTFRSI